MFKKALALAVIVVLLVGTMVMPASAAIIQKFYTFLDDGTLYSSDGAFDTYEIKVPPEYCWINILQGSKQIARSPTYGKPEVSVKLPTDLHYKIIFAMKANYLLWLDNLPESVNVTLKWDVDCNGAYNTPGLRHFTNYYNYASEGEVTGDVTQEWIDLNLDGTNRNPIEPVLYGVSVNRKKFTNLSDEVACKFGIYFYEFSPLYSDKPYTFTLNSLSIFIDVPCSVSLQSQIDEMPEKFGDEMQGVIDEQNQQASNAGDSAAGELMDIIPNESQGFMDAIQSLVSSMSYNGTDAKLPVPAITIPAIPGVMDAIQLTDELYVDFGYWVQKLPSGVLNLVQILCTIALIVYCFKELYSMIAYAMTLKGGGSGE